MSAPELVVMAAGMGSRYGGLKQLEPLGPGGETLLDYSVHDAVQGGFGRVIFVIRKEMEEEFRRRVAARFERRVEVRLVEQRMDDVPEEAREAVAGLERVKPWGTGHALLSARREVRGPFAVINADDFYGRESFRLLGEALRGVAGEAAGPARAWLVAYTLSRTLSAHGAVSRGVCEVEDGGTLRKIVEMTHLARGEEGQVVNSPPGGERQVLSGDEPASLNCWGFGREVLPLFEREFGEFLRARGREPGAEFYLTTALDRLLGAGELTCRVLRSGERWMGVTVRGDVEDIRRDLAARHAAGEYPTPLLG